uniref:transporter associated domain-containing protein n=1 Tax=Accumulibacter sp. TaxID=2053492 RepID=UPI0028C4DD4D
TIGGVALVLFGRLPRVGEKVFSADYEITVKEVSGMRITKVRVSYGRTLEELEGAPEQPLDMESIAADSLDEGGPDDQEQETLDEYEDDLLRESAEDESESSPDDQAERDQQSAPSVRSTTLGEA